MKKPFLRIENLTKVYHTKDAMTLAVEGFCLDVYENEFVALVGPSGCGKSTILSMLSGLIKPTYGSFEFNKEDISLGYMLQQDYLFSWRNILDNIMLGLEIKGIKTDENIKYAEKLIKTYGLEDFKKSYPKELSGGMRQRAALIRTLALNPQILLLDEPFSALDYQTRLLVGDDISNIIRKEGKTAVLVTHDLAEAISMANRVVVLTKRPSKIKNIYDISLTCESNSAIEKRKAPEFGSYYDKIWKDVDLHV